MPSLAKKQTNAVPEGNRLRAPKVGVLGCGSGGASGCFNQLLLRRKGEMLREGDTRKGARG